MENTIADSSQWFKNLFILCAMWFIGQLIVEWVKIQMRNYYSGGNYNGSERRKEGGLIIDADMVRRGMSLIDEQNRISQHLSELLESHRKIEEKQLVTLEEHIKSIAKPMLQIDQLYQRLVNQGGHQ